MLLPRVVTFINTSPIQIHNHQEHYVHCFYWLQKAHNASIQLVELDEAKHTSLDYHLIH
jgi:hypothetical protein